MNPTCWKEWLHAVAALLDKLIFAATRWSAVVAFNSMNKAETGPELVSLHAGHPVEFEEALIGLHNIKMSVT